MFRWQISDMMIADTTQLSNSMRTLMHAIFYASANSLTNDQCLVLLQTPKRVLLDECQLQCEKSLLGPDLFCVKDILTIKAVIFYVVSYQGQRNVTRLMEVDRKYRPPQHAKSVVYHGNDFAQC